jgi:dihydroorotate dehydrogenase (NAD+) catalytic subunit
MVINIDTMRPQLGGKTGGLSGPAIVLLLYALLYQVHAALLDTPIIGNGWNRFWKRCFRELTPAGATGVSIGTASFGNPTAIMSIQNELKQLLIERGFTSLKQAIGYAHRAEGENVNEKAPIVLAVDTPELETAIAWVKATQDSSSSI